MATLGRSGCGDSRQCRFDFEDGDTWRNVTPRVGLQRRLGEDAKVYAHYTKGFRSGGYNLRNTSSAPPGPFDEEEQDSFEVGLKSEPADRRARFNLALYHNRIYGMQRQVTRADVVTGGVRSRPTPPMPPSAVSTRKPSPPLAAQPGSARSSATPTAPTTACAST